VTYEDKKPTLGQPGVFSGRLRLRAAPAEIGGLGRIPYEGTFSYQMNGSSIQCQLNDTWFDPNSAQMQLIFDGCVGGTDGTSAGYPVAFNRPFIFEGVAKSANTLHGFQKSRYGTIQVTLDRAE
jgi:hypothetical protein